MGVNKLGKVDRSSLANLSIAQREQLLKLASAKLTRRSVQVGPIARADRSSALPLSWAQQRLWFLDQLDGAAGAAYHIPAALRLEGGLDLDALQASLNRIVARHEVLRTRFVSTEGEPAQVIESADVGFALTQIDLSDLSESDRRNAVSERSADEASRPFDLTQGPLIRGQLLRLADQEHVLLITQHHSVSDGWSTGLLVKEISALYAAFCAGQSDPLDPLPIQYTDYAVWQRSWLKGETLQRHVDFWRQHLVGAPALLALPTDRPRPTAQSYRGDRAVLQLSESLAADLKSLSQRHGVTLFMTMLAAWSAVLSRLCGLDDIVIGSPVANRQRKELEPLVGLFVNTLALRVRLSPSDRVGDLLQQVKKTTLAAYAHQELPFDQVVEAVQPSRSLSQSPIFQVMLSLNNTPGGGELKLPGLQLSRVAGASHTAQFDLSLSINEGPQRLSVSATYATDLFDRLTVERMLVQWQRLLSAMVADDTQLVSRLPLLSATERDQVLVGFNATATADRDDQLIHQVFQARAELQPDAVALVDGDHAMSYGELHRRSDQIAHRLIALGVEPDDRVAICVQRSPTMVIAMLGVLKAGAAYVPLDPIYPAERLRDILSDSAPAALVTQPESLQRLPQSGSAGLPTLVIDGESLRADTADCQDLATPELSAGHLAYVIYTSGSTGRPKGVMIEHASVVNQVRMHIRRCALKPGDRVLQFASYAFDSSVVEIFPTLCSGATLVLRPSVMVAPDLVFADFLRRQRINMVDLPTAFWHQWVQEIDAGRCTPDGALRLVVVGGEKVERPLLAKWLAAPTTSGCGLLNTYGPTEATVYSTAIRFDRLVELPAHEVPIGRPCANTQIYILDRSGEPVPVGVTGEICIAGSGVARGYLGQSDLTAQRFVDSPYSSQKGARFYKTGDLGRWLPDGNIAYMGRQDSQVKIRGFRIELGEVEARLLACPGVAEAVVSALPDALGVLRLVAYVVAKSGATFSPKSLRKHLQTLLPEFMIPSVFVSMNTLPLTVNGKLDHKALPAPEQEHTASQTYAAPKGPLEKAIADVWAVLLGRSRVGRNDNFFELGGHSLMAIKVVSELKRTLGIRTSLSAIFRTTTVAEFASDISDNSESGLLVTLAHPGAPSRPVFCVHPIGGQVFPYQALAKTIGESYQVYGVQSAEIAGLSSAPESLEAMARQYGEELRKVQSVGPYRILGWSTGGLIATAVANYLNDSGDEVEYLGLIDSYPLNISEHAEQSAFDTTAALTELKAAGFELKPATLDQLPIAQIAQLQSTSFQEAEHWMDQCVQPRMDEQTYEHFVRQIPITAAHIALLANRPVCSRATRVQRFWADESTPQERNKRPSGGEQQIIKADHYGILRGTPAAHVGTHILGLLRQTETNEREPADSKNTREIGQPR